MVASQKINRHWGLEFGVLKTQVYIALFSGFLVQSKS
jgi:hypothetical protein